MSAMGGKQTFFSYQSAMTKFGFVPCENDDSGQQPIGYATATVHLGEHTETVAFWPNVWSAGDYVQHWQETAAAMFGGQSPALFCTDYAPISCSCFVGWRTRDGFVFEEWVIKHEDLSREGRRLTYTGRGHGPRECASHFPVAAADVEMLVGPRS